ncbi:unnamed protein product [Staurois parvus]|uniref:Uncharacterized protein n=1 Tax=Staurois parvus TaxID=386267 RepID=A0ABN9DNH1_9NEOB|nr:unnamed protein product [Staurois parvus]
MCHFQVSSHCWCVQFFDIGCWQITGPPHSCGQAPNLPWAPVPTPLMLLPGSTVSHAMCHFLVSSHCWCVPFFVIRVLADYGPPIAAARGP